MSEFNLEEFDPEEVENYIAGDIPVDTGRILIVDPCHIPVDLLMELQERGLGVVFGTPYGDGWIHAYSFDHELMVVPEIAMDALAFEEEIPEGCWKDASE